MNQREKLKALLPLVKSAVQLRAIEWDVEKQIRQLVEVATVGEEIDVLASNVMEPTEEEVEKVITRVTIKWLAGKWGV